MHATWKLFFYFSEKLQFHMKYEKKKKTFYVTLVSCIIIGIYIFSIDTFINRIIQVETDAKIFRPRNFCSKIKIAIILIVCLVIWLGTGRKNPLDVNMKHYRIFDGT